MNPMTAVRRCPNCRTVRPASELNCQGTFEGNRCNWELTNEELLDPAWDQSAPPEQVDPAPSLLRRCPAGHIVDVSDLQCPTCGADLDVEQATVPCTSATSGNVATSIAGWMILERLTSSDYQQTFRVRRDADGRTGLLTLHATGSELDEPVYRLLQQRIDRDYIAEVLDFGIWQGQAFEVTEEIFGGTLQDFFVSAADVDQLRIVVEEIGAALAAFAELGLRHRAISPQSIRVRSREPLDLVISDFGAARLSDLDLDLEAVPAVSVYTAPEAMMGGVAAASDWWGLGMVLLHVVTQGKYFQNINQQVFLIRALSSGVPIPEKLPPEVDGLLRGLLTVDRSQRWQQTEVRAWLAGHPPPIPAPQAANKATATGPAITLGGSAYRDFLSFTLAAPNCWDEAADLLERGSLATWASEQNLDKKSLATLRVIAQSVNVPRDFRLGLALRLLNPSLPLLHRQLIIGPKWLTEHPEEGFELIFGPTMDLLRRLQLEADTWLRRLAVRASEVRSRARQLQIDLDETDFRLYALSSSRPHLFRVWATKREQFPDTEHSGLAGLLERQQLSDEDLHILLSAAPGQFRSASELAIEVQLAAEELNVNAPPEEHVRLWLSRSRQEVFSQINERIHGFARCGHPQLDVIADRLRLERRIPLAHAILLLAVPEQDWQPPPNQEYLSSLLGFFEKRVKGSVLRGPLVRMKIGKWTPRIDLTELGVDKADAAALLERLLQRTGQSVKVNPRVFAEESTTEARLHRLVTQSHTHRRDTGVNGLYFGFPFLLRQVGDRSIRPHLAPLLLWPLRIEAETGRAGNYSLAFEADREVLLNPAFEGLLGAEAASAWQQAADELLGRSKLTIADVMDAFGTIAAAAQRQLRSLPDLLDNVTSDQVICAATLFHATFVGQAIAQDLRVLHATPPTGSALATLFRLAPPKNLAADSSKSEIIATMLDNVVRTLQDSPGAGLSTRRPQERYLLTSTDPSQEQAVSLANQPPGLLIQGPPGTGKSQTIVNLVADTIGQNKSALIICQKLQALNVVKKRLIAEGLADRLVMVTDVHRDRRPILEDVRTQLAQLATRPAAAVTVQRRRRDELVQQIHALEAEIDRRYELLHRHDELSGQTYRQIIGQLVAIEDLHAGKPLPEIVRLRRLMRDRPARDVYEVAQGCLALGDLWWAANYEGSPLTATRPLQLDQATINELQQDFAAFVECESARVSVTESSVREFEIEQPAVLEEWLLQHGATLEAATAAACDALRLHHSLFTKFQLGGEYLQLLERIMVVEEGWAAPCPQIPALERHLQSNDSMAAEQIAEECQRVAHCWIAAKYEESPLHDLAEFSDPSSIPNFHDAWESYQQTEAKRQACVEGLGAYFDLRDPAALENWLVSHQDVIGSATDNLYRSLPPFRSLVEQQAGPQFVALLGDLLDCHEACFGTQHLPELESLLVGQDEQQVREISAKCQNLLDTWLVVDYPDQPLHDLADFAPTHQNETALAQALGLFCAAESEREASLELPLRVAPGTDLKLLQAWLAAHERTLVSVDASLAAEVVRWQKLFLCADAAEFAGLQRRLTELIERLRDLVRSSPQHELRPAVSRLPEEVLQASLPDAKVLQTTAVWWSYLHLRQLLARRRLHTRWQSQGVEFEPRYGNDLANLLSVELQFRQLCRESRELLEWIGADPNAATAEHLLNQVQPQVDSLARVGHLISLLLSCPVKLDVPVICQAAHSEVFQNIIVALNNEVRRQSCAGRSLQALQGLEPWFRRPWIADCWKNVTSQQSNWARLTQLQTAWPQRGAYIRYRAETDEKLLALLVALRPRREQWLALSSEARQQALLKTLLGHWSLARKREWETRFPILSRLRVDVREELAKAARLIERLEPLVQAVLSCPDAGLAQKFATAGSATVARQLLSQLGQNLDLVSANEQARASLARLNNWLTPAWLRQRGTEISSRRPSTAAINAITAALPTLPAFQEFRCVSRSLLPSTQRALAILASERARWADLPESLADRQLQRVVLYHATLGSKRRIEQTVASLSRSSPLTRDECAQRHAVLSQVAPLITALDTYPLPDTGKTALASASRTVFRKIVDAARGAVSRAKCRDNSLAALHQLADWMQPAWMREQEGAVRTNQTAGRLAMLQTVANAWPQLGPYQAFRLRAAGLPRLTFEVLELLAAQRPSLEKVSDNRGQILHDVVRREALLSWKQRVEQDSPALLTDQQQAAMEVEELGRLDSELKQLNRKLIQNPPEAAQIGAPNQWEDITRYQGARALRLREFFKRGIPLGLKRLRPVWLMIPEVASQLLPLEPGVFDLVIYDEASQLPVECAVPSLYRSQQVVISGDEKQMPPSSAFKARIDSDEDEAIDDDLLDDDADEEERQAFEETWNRREIKDCPDLLHLGQAVLPKSTLQIHYRSEHRELIAFSNAAFYNNELCVPNQQAASDRKRDRPIDFYDVGGIYENQTNEVEADRVVELLAKIWRAAAAKVPSTGIVTFNMKQADLIETKLELKATEDDRFRRCLERERERNDDGEDMALFVKNVENVQGDERDVIIFSTTFGRSPAGVFRRNFGALGQKGGERRLNVAVTRARKKIMIVTSMPIGDISDLLTTRRRAQSPRDYLQAYLEYARLIAAGQIEAAHAILARFAPQVTRGERTDSPEDGIQVAIRRIVESLGFSPSSLAIDPILNVSCPVLDPQSGGLALGIDCDPPSHALLRRARAREIWRKETLGRSYRALHTISPRAWYHERDAEEQRLRAQLELLESRNT
jgi:DNA polymerase III delta prime subunit